MHVVRGSPSFFSSHGRGIGPENVEKKRGSKPPLPAHTFFPAPKEIISILEPTALTDKGFRIGMGQH